MTTFNKILNPVYSTIAGFGMNPDGSMNVTYQIGTATEENEQITEFNPLVTEYKYLDASQVQTIMFAPLTKDCIGKSFQDLMLGRIYHYMKEQGMIQV
ncbi:MULTISPECIES: hypothetical protein [Glaesserella]|uniref:Uncharacterized protein n=1 Tax=Glaesserella australis TaxID=2094024 RepID=A0A328BXJ1_9PAST|nr:MULTISPECIES: hypothetical protein [Glaesserella]AUI65635.1 hypothetical protein CJD39_03170 [Glaesserella sp. 15-184]RAL19078.1 hypothetical protein C5N92_04595 [Glaesserella australis]